MILRVVKWPNIGMYLKIYHDLEIFVLLH
jgi:hypothetical protein